jgi:RNA-directed DNA polymerase
LVNTDELEWALVKAGRRVLEIQTKLHGWAVADPHRRFDDLMNLVADPAFLLIPKPGTAKRRRLGISTIRDRVVQASLKLVLEPIFEAEFLPCSYGFRPNHRVHDAVSEVRHFTSHSYEWIVEGDIRSCFDEISHPELLDRVRRRIGDRRVLALVKAFLKAGILTEEGALKDTDTGTPQGGLCSAEHNPPYAQCRVMRSAGVPVLVVAGSAGERCA